MCVCLQSGQRPNSVMCEIILGLVPTNHFALICKSEEEARSQPSNQHTQTHLDANIHMHTLLHRPTAVTSVPGWGVEFPTIAVVFIGE